MGIPFTVAIVLAVSWSCSAETTCYSTDQNPYRHYGWKTNYDTITRNNSGTLEVAGCQPVLMFYIGRHGSRYPEKSSISDMEKYLPDIQQAIINSTSYTMCSQDHNALKGWTLRMNQSQAQLLVETGEREHFDIAQRFKGRLPSLLNKPYNASDMKIRHTDTQRTKFSAKYFARGIYGSSFNDAALDLVLQMEEKPSKEDFLLRYYSLCDKWQQTVYKLPIKELEDFDKSDTMTEILEAATKKFGLSKRLTIEELEAAYKMCAYDHIMFGVPNSKDPTPRKATGSPWCAGFTTKELKALEYRDDIIDYYRASYAHNVNAESTCPMTKDIEKHVKMAMDNTTGDAPTKVLRFGHAYTMITMQTRLGLFKDLPPMAPLKGSDYNETRLEERLFKSTNNIPMATGIGFFLYKCGDEYKFKVTVNEEEVSVFGCESLCPVNVLLGNLGQACDYEAICKMPAPKPSTTTKAPVDGVAGNRSSTWTVFFFTVAILFFSA